MHQTALVILRPSKAKKGVLYNCII